VDTLISYIQEGEHQTQDFKFRVDDAKKIARTIAAFSNTDGGRLLIGVKDNGKVVGINPEEEFHIMQGACSMYCQPEVEVKTNIIQHKHKLVLEVIVPEAGHKPVKAKDENGLWKTYVRREDHTLLANKILIGVWKKQKKESSAPQVFDTHEMEILNGIKTTEDCTLSKLYRKTRLKKSYIDKVLVLMISWGVIDMRISPAGTHYHLVDQENS